MGTTEYHYLKALVQVYITETLVAMLSVWTPLNALVQVYVTETLVPLPSVWTPRNALVQVLRFGQIQCANFRLFFFVRIPFGVRINNYLLKLSIRRKRHKEQTHFQACDLVLLIVKGSSRNQWKTSRVFCTKIRQTAWLINQLKRWEQKRKREWAALDKLWMDRH